MSEESQKIESRRKFLKGAGVLVAAATVAGCAAKVPVEAAPVATCPPAPEATCPPAEPAKAALPEHPWTYSELDLTTVRQIGHQGCYDDHCCYGGFVGVINALAEKVGAPFDTFPTKMFGFGAGGIASWGSTCGALIGAAAAINLFLPFEDAIPLVNELMGWYTVTPLPTKESNDLAVAGQFLPKEMRFSGELVQVVPTSPLCHVSISRWCAEAKVGANDPKSLERCSRLTGDVAAKAAELLNAKLAGSFTPVFKLDDTTTGCLTCHSAGTEFETGHFTRGVQQCTSCHEPHN